MADLTDHEEDGLLMPVHSDSIPISDNREDYEKQRAVNFILLSTLFERIAFYAFLNTLFITLRLDGLFNWNNQHSKTASYIFSGVSYTSTLIFAVISDWKLGRAKTIIIGFVLYLIGFTIITITSSGNTFFCHIGEPEYRNATSIIKEKCAPTIIATLVLTALGVGAVKSNLVVFGAEQTQYQRIKPTQDQKIKQASRYFEKYALAANIGSMIALVVFPYVQSILEYHHYYILYIVAVSIIFISFLLFVMGWRNYLHININETVIFNCIPIMLNACRSWYRFRRQRHALNKRREYENNNNDNILLGKLNDSQDHTNLEESIRIRENLSSILDFAKAANGGRFRDRHVNDVKSLRGALVVFTLLIPFWLCYDQISATFQSQGEQMRGSTPSYIVSYISLGDPVIVIIGIVLNIFVYKYLNNRHGASSISKKFIFGMFFALASMCVAGIVEFVRQKKCKPDVAYSELSVFFQLPQSILLGFSQLFGMVGGYEYAYLAAPLPAQSLFMSLYFGSIGMSFLIGTMYFNVFPNPGVDITFECNKNEEWVWSYYTYFFIIAGLQLIFMIIFIICYKIFKIVRLIH